MRKASRLLDPEKIAAGFIERQKIYQRSASGQPEPVAEEYVVSVSEIRDQFLPDVDFRGSTSLFNHLTTVLDAMVLRSLKHVENRSVKIPMNLDVESVFIPEFRQFTKDPGEKSLNSIQLEFRLTDVTLNFSQYNLIRQLVARFSGSMALDSVFPDIAGAIRSERINPSVVKILWRADDGTDIDTLRDRKSVV